MTVPNFSRCALGFLLVGLLAITAVPVMADELPEELFGTWTGNRTEFINGLRYDGTMTVRIRATPGGGASFSGKITFPGIGSAVTNSELYPNGTFSGSAQSSGRTINSVTGNWSSRRGIIRTKGIVRDIALGTYSLKVTYRPTKKRLALVNVSRVGTVSVNLRKTR